MRFVIIGDMHFTLYDTEEGKTARDTFFSALFARVAEQQAELNFAVGDIVQNGYPHEIQELYDLAARYGVQLISITGNHDIAVQPKSTLRAYFVAGKATGNELYYAFSQGGVRFVLLDTGKELVTDQDWGGYLSPEQLKWLASETTAFRQNSSGDHTLVVMGHHPLSNTTSKSAKEMMNIANSDEVRVALGPGIPGRTIYACGHNHVNNIVGPDATGWTYLQSGAPLQSYSFRVVTADETGVKVETVDFGLDDETVKAAVPVILTVFEHFSDDPLEVASGTSSDREWSYRAS
ncbi:MAG TPA: metallophosphoesterase [Chloroflexia bacterium]|nr:metallophosphoesterase [Chloroflexia bacterium]